jgi:cold shock CspA family protein
MLDKNDKFFTFIGGVFVHESALRDNLKNTDITKGDVLYYDIAESPDGRPQARNVSIHPSATTRKVVGPGRIRTGLYVPYIKTWGDGRSLTDPDCPSEFRNSMAALVPRLERAVRAETTSTQIQREIGFLLCCMHRDTPSSVSSGLKASISKGVLDDRAYAFALGDLAQDWQYETFLAIWNRADGQTGRADGRMLSILATAIWRTEGFVRVFDQASLTWLLDVLLRAMYTVNGAQHPGRGDVARLTEHCELLLGLLRSRDSEVPEVRLILQPHQEVTRNFTTQVEAAVAFVERSGLAVWSRVEIADLPEKPEGDTTPDLLYALRLYLTGDVGANAIRVTGVVDGEGQGD